MCMNSIDLSSLIRKFTSVFRETDNSRNDRGLIEGPLSTPLYHSLVNFKWCQGGPQLGSHDAERRRSLKQLQCDSIFLACIHYYIHSHANLYVERPFCDVYSKKDTHGSWYFKKDSLLFCRYQEHMSQFTSNIITTLNVSYQDGHFYRSSHRPPRRSDNQIILCIIEAHIKAPLKPLDTIVP